MKAYNTLKKRPLDRNSPGLDSPTATSQTKL